MKRNFIAVISVCLLIFLLIRQLNDYNESRVAVSIINDHVAHSTDIIDKIDNLYLNDRLDYLERDIDEEDIQEIQALIEQKKQIAPVPNQVIRKYNELYRRFYAQSQLNQLYQQDLLQGDRVQLGLDFKDNLNSDKIEELLGTAYYPDPQDAFQTMINQQIDYVRQEWNNYQSTMEELAQVDQIPTKSRNLNLIARAMAEAEAFYALITNPGLKSQADQSFQDYGKKFLDEIKQIPPLPKEFVRDALAPSEYMLLIMDQMKFQE